MPKIDDGEITVEDLLKDPLLQQYSSGKISRNMVKRVLVSPSLSGIDAEELTGMDTEELFQLLVTNSPDEEQLIQEVAKAEEKERLMFQPAAFGGEEEFSGAEPAVVPSVENVRILIDDRGFEAKVVLTQPNLGSPAPTVEDILSALKRQGVECGILMEYVTRLGERPIFGRIFKIAAGTPAVDGRDGSAAYFFNTVSDLSPKINENGVADYKEINFVENVKQGQVLCEITPPTKGQDGVNVFGETVRGKDGHPANVICGSNTIYSEDKTKIIAACDGQVRLKGNRVTVSRVLTVNKVDASTGNLIFAGTIQVLGDVAGGFSVRAGGNVIVRGIAENAQIVAGGNIVLCGGMKGQETGLLDAGGTIRTFFIESAKVRAKEDIYADVILNSTVECGGQVNLSGENGRLVGGECFAAKEVRAFKIGNEANIGTRVVVNQVSSFCSESERLTAQITKCREAVELIRRIAEYTIQNNDDGYAAQYSLLRAVLFKQRLERSIALLNRALGNSENGKLQRKIIAREVLYPNVSLEIEGAVFRNKVSKFNCTVTNAMGKIKIARYRFD